MIDDEKIEKACDKAFKNSGFNTNDVYPYVKGFYDCARWAFNEFRKDLWHPASEKPVMSEHGMILVELNDITSCKYSLWRSTTTYECLCNNKGYIRRWLYLDDLLSQKGGEK